MTELTEAAREAVERHVGGYVLYPVEDWSTIKARERSRLRKNAEFVFDHQPPHQCYWNNRFCIAVTCGLSKEKQRQAAWCLVANGLNDYWEWFTHAGYPTHDVLHHLKITSLKDRNCPMHLHSIGVRWDSLQPGYSTPSRELLAQIVKHFNLPTTRLWERHIEPKDGLSPSQLEKREQLNKLYPYDGLRRSLGDRRSMIIL
jgi:hypothetical protein